MATHVLATLLSLSLIFQQSSAQIGADARWIVPNGSKPDLSTSFTAGDTITISWKALNQSRNDLWLTQWEPQKSPYHYQVASNIDISVAGTFDWYINVNTSVIKNNPQFNLRFYPLDAPYGLLQFNQLPSPGFLLTGGVSGLGGVDNVTDATPVSTPRTSTTTSMTSTSTSTSSATSSPAASPAQSSSTTSPSNISSSQGLPVGAQVGIGVAAGLFVIALFIAGYIFGRRYRSRRDQKPVPEDGLMLQKEGYSGMTANELPSGKWDKSRAPYTEMGSTEFYAIEKSGAMVRPGLHELSAPR